MNAKLKLLEDAVKEIDRRPSPAFESPAEINIPLCDILDIVSPPESAFGTLVIDSGVNGGHPLMGAVLGDAQVFRDSGGQFIKGEAEDSDTKMGI